MLSFTLLRLLAFTCLVQEDVWKQVNSMSETSFQNSFKMFKRDVVTILTGLPGMEITKMSQRGYGKSCKYCPQLFYAHLSTARSAVLWRHLEKLSS